jgi:guanylate kinase
VTAHRLIVLSGPSCAGKSPLVRALRAGYPDLDAALRSPVPYTSRPARPHERDGVDYQFRSRDEILALGDAARFVVAEVRSDVQALDVGEVCRLLAGHDVLYEGNVWIAGALLAHPRLADVARLGIFLAPLSREEIDELTAARASLAEVVTALSRRRLFRRLRAQEPDRSPSPPALADIETRAASAWDELRRAAAFDWVVPCHDGEDSDHWGGSRSLPVPIGDARRALRAVVALARGEPTSDAERWPSDLLSPR